MKIIEGGGNLDVGDITKDMLERRPLPIGRTQFEEWCARIIKGAGVQSTEESQRYILAERLQHIAPTDAFKEDAYFILQLRTVAVKETAFNMFEEIKRLRDERKRKQAEDTAPKKLEVVKDGAVLENGKV